ncbi:MAG: hypothetical protein JXR73_07240 [Candidatus Omnitrophica bacterium]|nr:hypothetical protein [Candidatus Omnitrophota bacterium]
MEKIKKFLLDEQGSEAAEYVILTGVVAIVIIIGASYLGNQMDSKLSEWGTEISSLGEEAEG